jgi:uncharacterized protein YacL
MEMFKKYIPLIFIIPILVRSIFNPQPLNLLNMKAIGIFVIAILMVVLFVYLERTMQKRARLFDRIKDRQFIYMMKFSLLYGLPMSLILTWLISGEVRLLYSVIFIVIPTMVMFGWAGYMDWKECQKRYLELKYSAESVNAA